MSRQRLFLTVGSRVGQILPVIVLATFIVFGLLQLVPGDIAVTLAGEHATAARIAEIREQYGLDRPFLVQYGHWLLNAVQGDLGRSFLSGESVARTILHRLPTTLLLVAGALLVSILIGLPLGVLAATRRGSRIDAIVTAISSLGIAVPNFWLAMILVSFFALGLNWFPATGAARMSQDPVAAIWHVVLPSLALGSSGVAEIARQTRSALIEVLSSQYVRTLRATGLPERRILWRHGLKNIGVTLLTVVGLLINRLLGATVVVEAVFAFPGLGSMVVEASVNKDFPVVQGVVLFMVAFVIATNLLIDLLYPRIDPRISR